MAKKLLPLKSEQPSEWYTTLIQLADLADYGSAKGTMIIKPYGYALWEMVQAAMDPKIKEKGVGNAYFPLLIPISLLQKEANHVEGFAPELAVVTHGGGEELEEKLVVRPTSETIMYQSYAKWIQSWRDLPVLMNQWNNVVRWEKRTMPFLRTSEFLWQEGHTAHATHEEAVDFQKWAMDMYADIYRSWFAMDGYVGYKSQSERFAGADSTLTFESLMPSGKALQACTSHDLGQNFSKPFEISFQDEKGGEQFVWQTSWGFSTRSLGGLILSHGDDNGLILPPKMAPVQVAIIPVKPDDEVVEYCRRLESALKQAGLRVTFDARDDETFGFKVNKWEVKGAPIILKIGGKEQQAGTVTAKARFDAEQRELSFDSFAQDVTQWLDAIQVSMLEASTSYLRENTREARDYEEFKRILAEHKGFVKVCWNDDPAVEARIKEETKATSRCAPIDLPPVSDGVDFVTGEPATQQWVFAQSY
jgi:prolyl-tRNA synthetase